MFFSKKINQLADSAEQTDLASQPNRLLIAMILHHLCSLENSKQGELSRSDDDCQSHQR